MSVEPADAIEARIDLPALIAGLSDPSAYDGADGPVEVVQTHISVVFLVGGRAYKIKKPLRLWGLVDYASFEARKHWCEEEVRLNRRLAPDLYLGVEPVVRRDGRLRIGGAGEVVEHAVVMVRLPEGATLRERLAAGTVTASDIEDVADLLARFHDAHHLPSSVESEQHVDTFAEVLGQNFEGTRGGAGALFPAAAHEGVYRRLQTILAGVDARLRRRGREGRAVDGHGDIRLEHVVRHGGRWAIMDCVEFTPRLRHIDPLSDLAFLSMDLAFHGRSDLARTLERAYFARTGDRGADMLLPLFRAYRAHVRAKVDYQTSLEPEVPAAQREAKAHTARCFFALAWTESRAGLVPPLLVLRGPSGTGKSVLAGSIAPLFDAAIVRSDVVRKELLGMAPTERPTEAERDAVYGSAMSGRTYATLLARGREALAAGRAAILDATYLRADSRTEARALAAEVGAPFAIIDITCDPAVVRERLRARSERDDDASDADWAVYLEQMETAEPQTEAEGAAWVTHASGAAPAGLAMDLIEVLESAPPVRAARRATDDAS